MMWYSILCGTDSCTQMVARRDILSTHIQNKTTHLSSVLIDFLCPAIQSMSGSAMQQAIPDLESGLALEAGDELQQTTKTQSFLAESSTSCNNVSLVRVIIGVSVGLSAAVGLSALVMNESHNDLTMPQKAKQRRMLEIPDECKPDLLYSGSDATKRSKAACDCLNKLPSEEDEKLEAFKNVVGLRSGACHHSGGQGWCSAFETANACFNAAASDGCGWKVTKSWKNVTNGMVDKEKRLKRC